MIRTARLGFFLCARAALASSPSFGPELTVSDLRPGSPSGLSFVHAWAENGEVVVIVARTQGNERRPARTTLRRDGTADPAALVSLPISSPMFDVTSFRGGMMAVWGNAIDSFAAPLDRDGKSLTQPAPIPITQTSWLRVICNEERCLVRGDGGAAIIDSRGNLVKKLDGPVAYGAVAGKGGFLVSTPSTTEWGSPNKITLLDNDGVVKAEQKGSFWNGVFDGDRYVVVRTPQLYGDVFLTAIDPVTGAWSASATVVKNLPFDLADVQPWLSWNGSMYLITMNLSPGSPPFPVIGGGGPMWLATMRVDRSFAPIDAEPQKQAIGLRVDSIVSLPDEFRFFWTGTEYSVHTAAFHAAEGTIAPQPPTGQPLLRDRSSQFWAAAAAGRTAILGVYREDDGEQRRLLAARITRSGARLDPTPIVLQTDRDFTAAAAASDGDGFLVVWKELADVYGSTPTLAGATIDAAGNAHTFAIGTEIAWYDAHLTVELIAGAYQVTIAGGRVEAFTISTAGTVLQHERFTLGNGTAYYWTTAALFDGRRIVSLWSDVSGLWSATKDVPGGAVTERKLLSAASPAAYNEVALLHDGNDYLALVAYYEVGNASRAARRLLRISRDGEIVGPTDRNVGNSGESTSTPTLIRIDGVAHAAFVGNNAMLEIVPLDGGAAVTFDDGYNRRLFAGWGEALLVQNATVPITSSVAWQMTIRIGHALLRPHAAGR